MNYLALLRKGFQASASRLASSKCPSSRYLGWDPDPNIRFQLMRDQNLPPDALTEMRQFRPMSAVTRNVLQNYFDGQNEQY